jgi:two-component system, LytTR family, sensor kinase
VIQFGPAVPGTGPLAGSELPFAPMTVDWGAMPPELPNSRTAGRWTPLRVTVVSVGAFAFLGLLSFSRFYFDDLTRGHEGTFLIRALEEGTSFLSAALLFPLVLLLCLRFPLRQTMWARRVPLYAGAALLFSALFTTLRWITRIAIFSIAGLPPYDYGIMSLRYVMELPSDLIGFAAQVAVIHAVFWYRESRARALRTAQLETRLAQAQLSGLRAQLQPHFLFNTLNTIAAAVYEDPARADALLTRLSELLRLSLAGAPSHETSLAEELRVAALYTDLMQARFEDRFSIRMEVEPGVTVAAVPQLVLQPLIENAIRHGAEGESGRVAVEVHCARHNGAVELVVRDHGAGFPEPAAAALGRGVGLQNTAERLLHLYGERATLVLGNASGGGAVVTVTLPWREATAP